MIPGINISSTSSLVRIVSFQVIGLVQKYILIGCRLECICYGTVEQTQIIVIIGKPKVSVTLHAIIQISVFPPQYWMRDLFVQISA